ncbi:hypothetical protein L1049_010214 [Liquidambar formosana]|uniref:Pentatricopeptide repeat-containing protein n=1 Tax=Liquidambar formosana TaxID=63359 RepID=A0AAP0R473_LIQFO
MHSQSVSSTLAHNATKYFPFLTSTSQENPIKPYVVKKCIALLLTCASSIHKLKQIHAFSVRHGALLSNPDMGKHLIFTLVSLSAPMSYAHNIFSQIQNPNIFTWNTMVRGYAESENPRPAIELYHQMHLSSIEPDTHTYPFLLKAIAKSMAVREGEKVHSIAVRNGFESLTHLQLAMSFVLSKQIANVLARMEPGKQQKAPTGLGPLG